MRHLMGLIKDAASATPLVHFDRESSLILCLPMLRIRQQGCGSTVDTFNVQPLVFHFRHLLTTNSRYPTFSRKSLTGYNKVEHLRRSQRSAVSLRITGVSINLSLSDLTNSHYMGCGLSILLHSFPMIFHLILELLLLGTIHYLDWLLFPTIYGSWILSFFLKSVLHVWIYRMFVGKQHTSSELSPATPFGSIICITILSHRALLYAYVETKQFSAFLAV